MQWCIISLKWGRWHPPWPASSPPPSFSHCSPSVPSFISWLFTCCNWCTLMVVTHCKNSFWPVNGRTNQYHPFLLGVQHPPPKKKLADLTTKRLDDVMAIMYHPLRGHVHPPMRCIAMVTTSALDCLLFIPFLRFNSYHFRSFVLCSLRFPNFFVCFYLGEICIDFSFLFLIWLTVVLTKK